MRIKPHKPKAITHLASTFLFATKSNGYSPGILKAKSLGVVVALFMLSQILFTVAYPEHRTTAADLTISNITAAINREREIRNLLTLNTHSSLETAAQSKADDMIARRYFSHTDPEGNFIWPKIVASGYSPYLQLGENLAIEFYNTESLVAAWMNSPTHRANVLNEGFKDQGMGLAFGNPNSEQYYSAITNTFGTLIPPKSESLSQPAQPSSTKTKPPASSQIKVVDITPKTQVTSPFQPSTTPQTTPPISTSKPITIKEDSFHLATSIRDSLLILSLEVEVQGPPDTVIVSLGDRSVPLSKNPPESLEQTNKYRGTIEISDIGQISASSLKVLAQNNSGSSDVAEFSLLSYGINLPTSGSTENNITPNSPPDRPNPYRTNRIITLIFGGALLLLLVSDTWVMLEKKLHLVDKKLNNAFVLFLALIITALIYFL